MRLRFWTLIALVAVIVSPRSLPEDDVDDDAGDEDDVDTEAEQRASQEAAGSRCIKSQYGQYLRAWANSSDWFVGMADKQGDCEQWMIEEHDGKIALKAHCSGQYLRGNEEHFVDLIGDLEDVQALWTPIKDEEKPGTWCLKSSHGTYLRAQPHGRVSLQTDCWGDEHFTLLQIDHLSARIAGPSNIKTSHGTWLRAWANATEWFVGTAETRGDCELWTAEDHDGKIALKAHCSGKYLHAHADGSLGLAAEAQLWVPNNKAHIASPICLQSAHGTWLHAHSNGRMATMADKCHGGVDFFWPEPAPSTATEKSKTTEEPLTTTTTTITLPAAAEIVGRHYLKSPHGTYLRGWANTSDWFVGLAPQGQRGDCEQWHIENRDGKVSLKAHCSGKYLRSNAPRYLDLADQPLALEMWTPEKNEDGTWCLKGAHDTYLRAHANGRVFLKEECEDGFKLEAWEAPAGIVHIPITSNEDFVN